VDEDLSTCAVVGNSADDGANTLVSNDAVSALA
jgi:hypothetical protein